MKTSWKVFIIVALVVVIGALILIFALDKNDSQSSSNAQNIENGAVSGVQTGVTADYKEKLAKFLTEKGMVLYGAYWCSHCKQQKELFGNAAQYIDYVECESSGDHANPDECIAKGIQGYPTWIYQEQKYEGTQTLAELAEIVGFSE